MVKYTFYFSNDLLCIKIQCNLSKVNMIYLRMQKTLSNMAKKGKNYFFSKPQKDIMHKKFQKNAKGKKRQQT